MWRRFLVCLLVCAINIGVTGARQFVAVGGDSNSLPSGASLLPTGALLTGYPQLYQQHRLTCGELQRQGAGHAGGGAASAGDGTGVCGGATAVRLSGFAAHARVVGSRRQRRSDGRDPLGRALPRPDPARPGCALVGLGLAPAQQPYRIEMRAAPETAPRRHVWCGRAARPERCTREG
jgi:hypothetical protein